MFVIVYLCDVEDGECVSKYLLMVIVVVVFIVGLLGCLDFFL